MKEIDFLIKAPNGQSMAADLTFNTQSTPKTLAIYVHGINGFKDWGGMDLIAKSFAEAGIAFLKFNYSLNGTTPDRPVDFVDLDAYTKDNYLTRQQDLKAVIDYSVSNLPFQAQKTVLIGHSRGGADVILHAAHHRDIDAIATWASPSNFKTPWSRWDQDKISQWQRDGVIHLKNGRTGQEMPISHDLRMEYLENPHLLEMKIAASLVSIPWLIVHGDADEAVPVAQAHELKSWNSKAELKIMPDTGHTFDRKHPWESEQLPIGSRQLVSETSQFILAQG